MSKSPEARWQSKCDRIMNKILALLPPDATLELFDENWRQASPCGPKAGYAKERIWMLAVGRARREMEARVYRRSRQLRAGIDMRRVASEINWTEPHDENKDVTCAVVCSHCDARNGRAPELRGGCLLCSPVRARWAATWAGRDAWAVLRLADAVEAEILADFLEDHAWPDEARWVRQNWPAPPKKRRKRKKVKQ